MSRLALQPHLAPADISASAWVMAGLLAQGRLVHVCSMLATSAGLLAVVAAIVFPDRAHGEPLTCVLAATLLGLLETYLAARIGLDRALFRRVGQGLDLATLDASLAALGLIDENRTGASIERRMHGCMRLMRCQAGVTAIQYILIVTGAVFALV